jgi:hypothetical protein
MPDGVKSTTCGTGFQLPRLRHCREALEAPAKQTEAPAKQTEAPAKQTEAPREQAAPPREQAAPPREQAAPPEKHVVPGYGETLCVLDPTRNHYMYDQMVETIGEVVAEKWDIFIDTAPIGDPVDYARVLFRYKEDSTKTIDFPLDGLNFPTAAAFAEAVMTDATRVEAILAACDSA